MTCPALYLLDLVSDPGVALLIMLGALLLGVLLPMIDRPSPPPGKDPVLPDRRRK